MGEENELNDILHEMYNIPKDYPLTDIALDEETEILFVEVALAGVPKENISIKTEGDLLIIDGTVEDELQEGIRFIKQSILRKDFTRKVKLDAKYVGGKINAEYNNGMLVIGIKPAKDYTKTIEIK